MSLRNTSFNPGVVAALVAALLFGASAPIAKWLLQEISPRVLAGLFYLGSGIGLRIYRLVTRAQPVSLQRGEAGWLAGAVLSGGIVGPVLLMFGLTGMPASGAALLLNAEGVLTALLAWVVFKENFDRRIRLGMLAIACGAVILSWPGEARFTGALPALAILGACLCWAIDNNLTRKVALADATWIAAVKGTVAGSVNLALGLAMGAALPTLWATQAAMVVGLLAYGVSLVLFVVGMRHLGTARTGAYFSVAPFFGAVLAVLSGEPVTLPLLLAGGLMALGIWLHLTEQHEHQHAHEALEHSHEHVHDEHHQHAHGFAVISGAKHTHLHRHEPILHSHAHFPDAHHQGHSH
ncbi:DMT family transporter [Uliginosibacterium gangwonense]|uniref:DMT family transporter n=1 Tax=Uliginosibacterium gangwonense TaxID=392736 RepID=UPI00035F3CAC|nr:DMT family transporter [Uliginosibacterium gangwonense]